VVAFVMTHENKRTMVSFGVNLLFGATVVSGQLPLEIVCALAISVPWRGLELSTG
jgi:hypothetical protein